MKNQSLEALKSFAISKSGMQGGKQREICYEAKQGTAAAIFLGTFGALPEVQFIHAIYHFKAQEVKNPMLQTVHDSEFK